MHGIGTRRAVADDRGQSHIGKLQELMEGRIDACGPQDRAAEVRLSQRGGEGLMGTYVGRVLTGTLGVGGYVRESLHFSAMSRQLASQISSSATYIQGVAAANWNGGKCDLVAVNVEIPGHWANYVSGGSGEAHDWR